MFAILKMTYGKSRPLFNSILFIFQQFRVFKEIVVKAYKTKAIFAKKSKKLAFYLPYYLAKVLTFGSVKILEISKE